MIQVAKPFVGEEEAEAVREVLLSGRYVSGKNVSAFEEEFAAYIGAGHGVAVNSGTAALQLGLAALGIGPGDAVIVPPITFFSTVTSVIHQNAVPVFADIDPETVCLKAGAVEKAITPETRALIVVHLFGQAAEMDEIMEVAKAYNLFVIEDCAQAHGTEYRGKKVGSIGHMGAFSFFATKHMTTGEGGMVTTSSADIADIIRRLRSHGMTDRDTHTLLGYNYRMNEIAAAIGRVQLKKLADLNQKRIDNSLYLLENLKGLDFVTPALLKPHIRHSFFWAMLHVQEDVLGCTAKEAVAALKKAGVEVRHRYTEPLYRQPVLKKLKGYGSRFPCPYQCPFGTGILQDYESLCLPNAEKTAGKMIGLPNHPGLEKEELDLVIDAIKKLPELIQQKG